MRSCGVAFPHRKFSLDWNAALSPGPAGTGHPAPRFGVNIHAIDDGRQLELAHAAGFSFVCADLSWRAMERNGQYRFAAADRRMKALAGWGLWIWITAGVISAVNLFGAPLHLKKHEIALVETDGPIYLALSGGPR